MTKSPSQSAPKSERVVQLLAATIRSAVRLRYARELSLDDSVDLARVHDLHSALKTIAVKTEVHQNLPDGRGFSLAVAEAKLTTGANLANEKIVAIREKSIATFEADQSNSSRRHEIVAALRTTQQETRVWAKAYARFLTEVEALYRSTNAELDTLHLPVGRRLEADSELQKLMVEMVRRAGEIPT